MTQANIDQLLQTRDKDYNLLSRAEKAAFQALKLEVFLEKEKNRPAAEYLMGGQLQKDKSIRCIEKKIKDYKNSSWGLYQLYLKYTAKIDRISLHLYGKKWYIMEFNKDLVEKRRKLEKSRAERKKKSKS